MDFGGDSPNKPLAPRQMRAEPFQKEAGSAKLRMDGVSGVPCSLLCGASLFFGAGCSDARTNGVFRIKPR